MFSVVVVLLCIVLVASLLIISILYVNKNRQHAKLQNELGAMHHNYGPIAHADREVKQRLNDVLEKELATEKRISALKNEQAILAEQYGRAKSLLDELNHQNTLLVQSLEVAHFGLYAPYFNLDTADEYKIAIRAVREKQKQLIKDDEAFEWLEHVPETTVETTTSITNQKKLMLRTFNSECDNLVALTNWNTITRMVERLDKSYESIKKLGDDRFEISLHYFNLKQEELRLTYEYELKRNDEKEELLRIKDTMRNEDKARKEYLKVQAEAEKEEDRVQKALAKLMNTADATSDAQRNDRELQINELRLQLQELNQRTALATQMSQQAKSGFVYVLSNVGSFGDNVYKIGATRRLDPLELVGEFGATAVPFFFDVHALFFSEKATDIESQLHKLFESKRLNRVNSKRDFFNVALTDIEKAIRKLHGTVAVVHGSEAKEYRESLMLLDLQSTDQEPLHHPDDFPSADQLFD